MRVLLRLLLLALVGCYEVEHVPATQVLLEIDSELEVDRELASLTVSVGKADGTGVPSDEHSYALRPAGAQRGYALPLQIVVLPRSEQRFRVTVTGFDRFDRKLITQRTITTFQARTTLWIPILLARVCVANFCDDDLDQVCTPVSASGETQGTCTAVPVDPGKPVNPNTHVSTDSVTTPFDAGADAAGASDDAGDKTSALPEDADTPLAPNDAGLRSAVDEDLPDTGLDAGPMLIVRNDGALDEAGTPETDAGLAEGGDGSLSDAGHGFGHEAGQDAGRDAGLLARPECMRWIERSGTATVPAGALARGSEAAYESWPGTAQINPHYLCRVDSGPGQYPGKLVADSAAQGATYGCFAHNTNAGQLDPRGRYFVLTLANECRAQWVASGAALPSSAVVAGSDGASPLVPCEAPVSANAFPLRNGDPYSAHLSDTHLGYVPADAPYRCHYEFNGSAYDAYPGSTGSGFSLLTWTP